MAKRRAKPADLDYLASTVIERVGMMCATQQTFSTGTPQVPGRILRERHFQAVASNMGLDIWPIKDGELQDKTVRIVFDKDHFERKLFRIGPWLLNIMSLEEIPPYLRERVEPGFPSLHTLRFASMGFDKYNSVMAIQQTLKKMGVESDFFEIETCIMQRDFLRVRGGIMEFPYPFARLVQHMMANTGTFAEIETLVH